MRYLLYPLLAVAIIAILIFFIQSKPMFEQPSKEQDQSAFLTERADLPPFVIIIGGEDDCAYSEGSDGNSSTPVPLYDQSAKTAVDVNLLRIHLASPDSGSFCLKSGKEYLAKVDRILIPLPPARRGELPQKKERLVLIISDETLPKDLTTFPAQSPTPRTKSVR